VRFEEDDMKLTGTVIGTAPGWKATLLIIEYREKDTMLKLAVRCYEGNEKLTNLVRGLEKEEVVDVVGSLSSREAKGQWYTGFEAQEVTLVKGVDRSESQLPADNLDDSEPAF
jgi:hypothetical protein